MCTCVPEVNVVLVASGPYGPGPTVTALTRIKYTVAISSMVRLKDVLLSSVEVTDTILVLY